VQLEEEEEEEVILPEITPEMEETIRRAIAARSTDVLVDSYRIQISGKFLNYALSFRSRIVDPDRRIRLSLILTWTVSKSGFYFDLLTYYCLKRAETKALLQTFTPKL
jgi:hypothetical protein